MSDPTPLLRVIVRERRRLHWWRTAALAQAVTIAIATMGWFV